MQKRKLIEVALPLEAINRESAREKSIRHGHPSTLHLWWARRPLAAARATLFAQLVDDPSSHPDKFPTDEAQRIERDRLHGIIERLVVWNNIHDKRLFAEAHNEIMKSTNGNPPTILDPFAGGGTIPLEAQRLGLKARASDLNPVAVLINKALVEIPPKFQGCPPVYPNLSESQIRTWENVEGLASDVRAYGEWVRDQAEQRIGYLYPKATLDDGTKAGVIAWIWTRIITCPNPMCGIEMPLARSWWLSKKKNKESYVVPKVVADSNHPSGKRVRFDVGYGAAQAPSNNSDGTMSRTGGVCISCGAIADLKYIRVTAQKYGLKHQLMACVAEGARQRTYLAPTDEQVTAAEVSAPIDIPDQLVPAPNHDVDRLPMYGMKRWRDAFTNRQLVALATFNDLVGEAREKVFKDALLAGMTQGEGLDAEGSGAAAYADAVAVYLSLSVSRCTDYWSSLCSWHVTRETMRNVFGRQAIPMVWDFAESMPFSESTGGYLGQLAWVVKALTAAPARELGVAEQADAATMDYSGTLLHTDPPYYDNIAYSDLSDFFYVWQRRMLRTVLPSLFGTMLVPKEEELVANPYRHGGKRGAKEFFEDGFQGVFANARHGANSDYPIIVWYAFKQSDTSEEGTSSSGWETLLDGMIRAGWAITATWPIRSELGNRMIASGTNALASSIVLALRPRPAEATPTDRRGFIAALQAELPQALRNLQHGMIAPVDLPQAAIGPGMAVFSRYSRVLEADGSSMTVRSALARINEILDQVLNEQEGDFDATTRFAVAWYRQHGYGVGQFGVADSLARARNTSVDAMDRAGVLSSRAGKVTLLRPIDLPSNYDALQDPTTSIWEIMHHLLRVLECDGIAAAGKFLGSAVNRSNNPVDADLVKELAFLLFPVAERKMWTQDALSFNTLATSWPEILDAARTSKALSSEQGIFNFDEEY